MRTGGLEVLTSEAREIGTGQKVVLVLGISSGISSNQCLEIATTVWVWEVVASEDMILDVASQFISFVRKSECVQDKIYNIGH